MAESICRWCKRSVDSAMRSCPGCGAAIGRATKVTASGWTELPPIRDMAKLSVGDCTCQIEGTYVPVADFNLASANDFVYFAHHVLLWRDPQVEVHRMSLKGGFKRMLAGMPLVMTEAHGPGHIAFSRDEPGEMIALPLNPGQGVVVREHMFLAATRGITYDWATSRAWYQTGSGNETETHYPLGQFIDYFQAADEPGLLLLHASGNVFVRELVEGEGILVKPKAIVYMDTGIHTTIHVETPASYSGWSSRVIWLHLRGPGRVAVQSAYEQIEDNGRPLLAVSGRPDFSATAVRRPNPTAAETHPDPQVPGHQEMATLVRAAMVNGTVPPEAMPKLMEAAAARGLSGWDVSAIINALHAHRDS